MSELSKLRWHCRRGMKELDVALNSYLDKCYGSASEEEQKTFRDLLDLQDPYLYQLVCRTGDDERFRSIIQKVRNSIIS